MFLNFKAILVASLATVSLAKAYSTFDQHEERDFLENDFGLRARVYDDIALPARSYTRVDPALSSLSTRALLEELSDRVERRASLTPAEIHARAIARCQRILERAVGKTVSPDQAYALEQCRNNLFNHNGVMPPVTWKFEPPRPPSPPPAVGARRKAKSSGKRKT